MLIFEKYLIKKIALYFYIIFAIAVILVWLIKANAILSFVVQKGIGLTNFFVFSSLAIPEIFSSLLPISCFLSLILAYQSIFHNREIYALRNCGLNLAMLIKPAIYFAGILCISHLVLDFFVIPAASDFRNSKKILFENRFTNIPIEEKVFIPITKHITVYCEKKEGDNLLKDVFINDNRNNDKKTVIYAKMGQFIFIENKNLLVLYDGTREEISKDRHQIEKFVKLYFNISLQDYKLPNSQKRLRDYNIVELFSADNNLLSAEILTEIYNRIIFPLLNILLALTSSYLVLVYYQPIKAIKTSVKLYLLNFSLLGYFIIMTKIYQADVLRIIISFVSLIIMTAFLYYRIVRN